MFNLGHKKVTAKRASLVLHGHDVPAQMQAISCRRNLECVNPRHLAVGTRSDMLHRAVKAGRLAHRPRALGEQHGLARLTTSEVVRIRHSLAGGVSRTDIADYYGVSWQAIKQVVDGRTWSHVPEDAPLAGGLIPSRPPGESRPPPQASTRDRARFEARVDRTTSLHGCWLWLGIRGKRPGKTHGAVWIGRRQIGAHIAAYRLYVGPIPAGMCICHDCPGGDNPLCINPEHLFLGTPADNNRDMRVKGLGSVIREMLATGLDEAAVAHKLALPEDTVRVLVTWRPPRGENHAEDQSSGDAR